MRNAGFSTPCRHFFLVAVFFSFPALSAPVPRVLLAGDSWSALPQAFNTFNTVFQEYPGCGEFRSIGFRTAIVGARASEYRAPEILNLVAEELALHPTIDVVHLSLGGNDILYGAWHAGLNAAQEQAVFDAITADIEVVIDYILSLRPTLRIGLCGYTFGNHDMDGASEQRVNEALTGLERTKLTLAQSKDRVFYINNLGLMQYTYGIPTAEPPLPPHSVLLPGGYPGYTPMPGGDIAYPAPVEAFIDQDIHLTETGYAVLIRRCMNEFYVTWLGYPRVFEIEAEAGGGVSAVFRVRFSEPVEGVDTGDFRAVQPGASPEAAVTGVTGAGAEYLVTVSVGGGGGALSLEVLDDDTIEDLSGNPLGGPGLDNGLFSHNGALEYADAPPLEEDDFDRALEFLDIATAPYAELLNGFSFAPDRCDANGEFAGIDPVEILGNGLLDSCEFGLIRECLRHPDLDYSLMGGVSAAEVIDAWHNNLEQMRADLGGVDGLAVRVLRGIDSILAGYITLGDSMSTSLPVLLLIAVDNYNDFPLDIHVPNLAAYESVPALSLDGDADGDGFSNAEEYDYFMPVGGRALYLLAALQPGMTPELDCENVEGGTFAKGDAFCLTMPGPVELGGGFQWKKNGVDLTDGGYRSGAKWRTLHIYALDYSDTGQYTCEYDDGAKTPRVFGPVDVRVINNVPVGGPVGLALLTAVLCGVFCRRNGKPRR